MEEENIVLSEKENERTKNSGDSFWDLLKFGVLALIIVIPIRVFIAQPFIVSGTSMVPTFHESEYLIVDELSLHLRDPYRGEVIIFKAPPDTSKYYIKRVIGLPGETLEIRGSEVYITNNEVKEMKLDEPYILHPSYNDLKITLKEDEYFVMGDNRKASSDSRVWGALPRKNVVGRAFIRLFPLNELSILPGNFTDKNK